MYTYYTYRPDGLRHSIGDKVHVWDGTNIVADVDGDDVVVYITSMLTVTQLFSQTQVVIRRNPILIMFLQQVKST